MAYTTPPTFVSGDVLTAAQLNVVSDDVTYLKAALDAQSFCGVALTRTSSQSIPDNSWTNVSWASANVETGGNWWTSGTDITVPTGAIPPGYTSAVLEVTFQARFDANGTGVRAIKVFLDGSTVEQSFYTSAISGETTAVSTTVWAVATSGQVITGAVIQNSGGSLDVTHLSIHVKRVGAL